MLISLVAWATSEQISPTLRSQGHDSAHLKELGGRREVTRFGTVVEPVTPFPNVYPCSRARVPCNIP